MEGSFSLHWFQVSAAFPSQSATVSNLTANTFKERLLEKFFLKEYLHSEWERGDLCFYLCGQYVHKTPANTPDAYL